MKISAPLYNGIYVLSPAINQHINFTAWEKQNYGVVLTMRGEVVGVFYDEQAHRDGRVYNSDQLIGYVVISLDHRVGAGNSMLRY